MEEKKKGETPSSFFSGEIADPPTVHAVYAALLAALNLSDDHRANLRQRGLTDAEIDRRGYRSLLSSRSMVIVSLRDRFGEETLLKVPGFVLKDGERDKYLTIAAPPGVLIPVRTIVDEGRIVAMRIRPDSPGDGGKYIWLSSAGHDGPSSGSPCHIPLGLTLATHGRVTEGELKADIATSLSGMPTVSIPGVGSWRAVLPVIKLLGWETVRVAFDADAATKKHVAQMLDGLAAELLAEGYALEYERWPAEHKGIDDALVAGVTTEVLAGMEARKAIAAMIPTGDGYAQVLRGEADDAGAPRVDEEEEEREEMLDWKEPPIDSLPLIVGNFVDEYASALAVHPASLALFSLTTIASCIGTSRIIRLEPTWFEPSIIFGSLICEPSTRKSAALEAATAPAEEWNGERFREHREAVTQYENLLEQFMAWSNNADRDKSAKPVKPKEPTRRRLIVKDITVETFIREHANNLRGLFMPMDELRMWFSSFGKYSKSGANSDECFWLSVFNGRKYDYDRKTGDKTSIHLDRMAASICGGVTPGCWKGLACQAMFDSGMIGRILLTWPPKIRYQGYNAPRESTGRMYSDLLRSLLDLDYEPSLQTNWKPVEMRLTAAASRVWDPWLIEWRHHQFEADGETAALLGKIEAYCARFALIFAVCDRVNGNFSDIVEEVHIRNAQRLAEWFAYEAQRVYLYSADREDADDMFVVQKVKERGERGMTARELWHGNPRRWKSIKNAGILLTKLAEKNLLKSRNRRYWHWTSPISS